MAEGASLKERTAAGEDAPVSCTVEGCHGDLLKSVSVRHKPVEQGGCGACHQRTRLGHPSSPGGEFALAGGSIQALCLGCHKKLAAYVLASKHRHTPVREGRCTACHTPHGGRFPHLLVTFYPWSSEWETGWMNRGITPLCWNCHDKQLVLAEQTESLTYFRDGSRNLHFLHVNRKNGRSCKACHNMHASDQEMHLNRHVPFGTGGWRLPITYTKTATGGRCVVGCHRPQDYDRGVVMPQGRDDASTGREAASPENVQQLAAAGADPQELRMLLLKLKAASGEERRETAQALGALGDPLAVPLLAEMIDNDENYPVFLAAAQALARIGGEDATKALAAGLERIEVRRQEEVARSFGATGNRELIAVMIAIARSAGSRLTTSIVKGFAQADTPYLRDFLRESLNCTHGEARIAAAFALEGEHSPERTAVLLEALHSGDSRIRATATRVLAGNGDAGVSSALVAALADKSEQVRLEAARAFGRSGGVNSWDEEVRAAVLSALADSNEQVRLEAAKALGGSRDPKGVAALWNAMRDTSHRVRTAAYDAILEISEARSAEIKTLPGWPEAGCTAEGCHPTMNSGLVVHRPVAADGCFVCHEGRPEDHPRGPGGEFSSPRGDNLRGFCFSCHQNTGSFVEGSKQRHQPVEAGRCLVCHDVHRSEYRKLLRFDYPEQFYLEFAVEQYALCWQCHDRDLALVERTGSMTAFSQRQPESPPRPRRPEEGPQLQGLSRRSRLRSGEVGRETQRGWLESPRYADPHPDGGRCVVGCHRELSYDRANPVVYR